MNSTPASALLAKRLDSERAKSQLDLKDRALAASAEGITIADARLPDNPLIYVNAGFERLTGYSAAEVLGRNCRFLQGPDTDPTTVDTLRAAIRERRAVTVQLLNHRKDGTPFWNRLSVTPVQDQAGNVTHFIGIQSDVTVEKHAKEALEAANEQLETASRAIRRDLEAAAELQHNLLPVELPTFPGFNFAYRFKPCKDVGGDSLNVLSLDDRHVALYILDVSGHGVAAALLSVTLTHMLSVVPERSFLYQANPEKPGTYNMASPAKVVARLNRHFLNHPGMSRYFTMIYGILNHETGDFRYVAAGHLGPLHFSRGAAPRIGPTGGMPVGLLAGATYDEHTLVLARGDRLYLSTDGILEAANPAGEEFAIERLLHSLQQSQDATLGDSLASVIDSVAAWSAPAGPVDDSSLLAVERE